MAYFIACISVFIAALMIFSISINGKRNFIAAILVKNVSNIHSNLDRNDNNDRTNRYFYPLPVHSTAVPPPCRIKPEPQRIAEDED